MNFVVGKKTQQGLGAPKVFGGGEGSGVTEVAQIFAGIIQHRYVPSVRSLS
jgi:hypothetical protein